MAIFSVLSIISTVLGLVRKAWDRLELAGAYVAGWMRGQKAQADAAENEIDDARDDRTEAEGESDEDLDDQLVDDEPDGVLDGNGVAGDTESGDHNPDKV